MSNVEPEPESQSSSGGFLTQKYGPLPAWAWGAIAAGGAYIFLVYRSKKSASTTTGTQTGTGTSTGTTNALTSNLVGVQQPTPILDGTYQVSVSPENAPAPVYSATTDSSTQGVANGSPPSGTLQPGTAPESPAANVTTPQTSPNA